MPGFRETSMLLHQNWRKNHRHHGGVLAVGRCCLGSVSLALRRGLAASTREGVDCVTFSVVPNLTALWAKLMERAIPGDRTRVWIGDSSGGFTKGHCLSAKIRAFPLINYLQGLKLDLFAEKFLRSEFFVVSDDDVLWLDETPWQWAMEQMARDSSVAVASLLPRERFHWNLNGAMHQPMGSYCLVVRRSAWLREQLSFQAVPKPSPSTGSYAGLYDTCDFANVALIKAGYRIAIAPPDIRAHLAAFNGVSLAILRIQKDPPEGYANAYGDGAARVVETCLIARALKPLLQSVSAPGHASDLANPVLIERAERELTPLVPAEQLSEMRSRVERFARRISESLQRERTPACVGS